MKLFKEQSLKVLIILIFMVFSLPIEAVTGNKKVSNDVIRDLVQKMTEDGFLNQDCINQAGGIDKVINVELIGLSKNGKPQFEISAGEEPTSCTIGARSSYVWLYDKRDNNYMLILDAGVTDQLKKTKEVTNGYFDVEVGVYIQAGAVLYIENFKFNGKVYEKKSSREVKNK